MQEENDHKSPLKYEKNTKIAAIRASKKIPIKKLSELSGIHRNQIRRLEIGEINIKNVTLINAIHLADALEVDVKELLE